MADMIVAGAGTTSANGTYVESVTVNGKPQYRFGSYYSITWSNIKWEIKYSSFVRYESTEDVATPDLCTTWTKGEYGKLPVPTVTAAGGSAQNLTLTCAAGSYSLAGVACTLTYTAAATGALRRTNMNAQMSNLTGGMHG